MSVVRKANAHIMCVSDEARNKVIIIVQLTELLMPSSDDGFCSVLRRECEWEVKGTHTLFGMSQLCVCDTILDIPSDT